MHWNYRLFKQDTPKAADGKHLYFVAECYYDDKGNPNLHSTMEHNLIYGDDEADTMVVYDKIAEAFTAPVIDLDENGEFKQ